MASLPSVGERALYAFDLKGLLYPFFTALPGLAARRTFELVHRVLDARRPSHAALCADTTQPTFRHELMRRLFAGAEYKGKRQELSPGARGLLLEQLRLAEETCLDVLGVWTIAAPGFEADDLLATLAREGREAGIPVVVVARDRDLWALADEPACVVWDGRSGPVMGREEVRASLGVWPEQVPDYFAIVGGKNDVPGVPGLGAVAAKEILETWENLDGALAAARVDARIRKSWAAKLRDGEAEARGSLQLARLHEHAPIPSLDELSGWSV